MVTSDMLLQLIADLQRDMTVTRGRRTLLKYAQSSTGARLALLFVVDKEHQTLVLLGQCGRRPQPQIFPADTSMHGKRFNPKRISQDGLFGAVLQQQGLLRIPQAYTDFRCLKEEKYWIGPDDHVILSAVGQQQAVLVLCFDPAKKTQPAYHTQAPEDEGNLLVCTTLLSAYLSDKKLPARQKSTSASSWTPFPADPPGVPVSLPPLPPEQEELYEIKLKTAIDHERSRIAHDIHDGPAQQIAHVIHKLEFIQRVLEKQPEVALREISRGSAILKESLHDLRHGISSLMPAQLEEQGFDVALQSLLDEYARNEPGLKIDYEREQFILLPRSLEAPVFRFIQEALNNVRKHAHARHVVVRIRMFASLLLVEVSDNGKGFDVEQVIDTGTGGSAQHMGLRTTRERIEQVGGKWDIASKHGEGTTVKARFHLATPSDVLTQREREVLRLLIEGLTNRQIAEKLSVSTETIKSHVHHIMQKMSVHDRTQAAVIATKQRWL